MPRKYVSVEVPLFGADADERNLVRDILRGWAAFYGFTTSYGPNPGRGNISQLLRALARGEMAVVPIPGEGEEVDATSARTMAYHVRQVWTMWEKGHRQEAMAEAQRMARTSRP